MGGVLCAEEDQSVVDMWTEIKNDLIKLMDSAKDYHGPGKDYDDGSFGPLFIRLAWHSSGTYDAKTGTGGSNGATMRFGPEKDDPENAGLDFARQLLEPLKDQYPVSYSDLWICAAYVFLEKSGGPAIEFRPGRVDKVVAEGEENTAGIENGRLPAAEYGVDNKTIKQVDEEGRVEDWSKTAGHVKQIFTRMGFNLREACALICGGHLYGRCHTDRSGYAGKWVEEPTVWSNEYAADMIEDTWIFVNQHSKMLGKDLHVDVCPAASKKQYIKQLEESDDWDNGQQMMLVADMILFWDDEFRPHLREFAEDSDLLKKEFGEAFKKLTELGCPWTQEETN